MNTRNKIIIFLTAITLGYILIFSGFIYFSIENYSYIDFYKRLEIRAITAAKIELEHQQDSDVLREIRQEFLEKLPNEKINIADISGVKAEVKAKKLAVPVHFIEEVLNNGKAFYSRKNTYFSGIRYQTGGKNYLVVVSAENYYSTHHNAYLKKMLIVALLISILIIALFAFLFSKLVFRPVQTIIKKIREISTENMHLRLEVPQNNEELRNLTLTFNDMLNRLETSFETQKNFISNASHELNTPLTSIMGEAEVTLAKERSPEEYREALNNILEDAEKLSKKTEALLLLAHTGYNGKVQKFELVRIDQLILDVEETVKKIYPGCQIHIDFDLLPETSEKLKVKGNKQLLHLAVSNVLMNACKYSDNKEVKIALGVSNDHVIIIIKDQGIGIPEKEMQYIYDPFFRASNTGNYHGYGIGLPLARNVIKMHHGVISVFSTKNRGTTVELKLPVNTKKF
ncbi:HAMP domain-containing histidine kinase [Sinomicrobium kalidii]|uniref:sensor histidine kinase n=1 Tax=Sinomicrobium kalidii TaxID=2900738 RepID=UPI001E5D9F38|nr:HAMP domain-containing sensor histidine kinase [Sinomicrobium kalidii]UGU16995.1 HAMP domain-containing histidine kinase [Sinomicrobium kalidii]